MLDLDTDEVFGLYWTKTMTWWVVAVDLTMELDYELYVWIGFGSDHERTCYDLSRTRIA